MANCTIKIPLSTDPDVLIDAAKNAIINLKGIFDGDSAGGHFKMNVGIGDIVGDYSVADGVMEIHITKKPLLVTCHMIESRLRGYLEPPVV